MNKRHNTGQSEHNLVLMGNLNVKLISNLMELKKLC